MSKQYTVLVAGEFAGDFGTLNEAITDAQDTANARNAQAKIYEYSSPDAPESMLVQEVDPLTAYPVTFEEIGGKLPEALEAHTIKAQCPHCTKRLYMALYLEGSAVVCLTCDAEFSVRPKRGT
jgi:hypothetical protein